MRVNPKEIIKTLRNNLLNISKTARDLNISRATVQRWKLRSKSLLGTYRTRGICLKRKSTKPHVVKYALDDVKEREVVRLRKQRSYDKRKLAYELKTKHNINVSPQTVYNIIKRREPSLIRDVSNFRRPKFQNGECMRPSNTKNIGYLQVDVKYVTPELSGLPYTTYEYACIDILSRYKMALILPILDESGSILTLKYIVEKAPFNVLYVQTDNGLEYQSQFNRTCEELGIKHYHIHKNSPNENAIIERSFRTDQEEFFFRLEHAPRDINELNGWFQRFLIFYNTERPHFSLEFKTPLEVVKDVSKVIVH